MELMIGLVIGACLMYFYMKNKTKREISELKSQRDYLQGMVEWQLWFGFYER